jgi:hypothetical protein
VIPSKEKYTNRKLAGDIESNGLLDKVTKLWCIVSQDVESGEIFIFHDYPEYDNVNLIDPDDDLEYTIPERTGTFDEGIKFWELAANNGSQLIVHNGWSYDRPLIEKFYPDFKAPDEAWWDTFIQSKMQWFERGNVKGYKGVHGLGPWGARLGIFKPEVEDWSFMDEFKLHRCIQDVKIQTKVYKYLMKERDAVQSKLGIDLLGGWETELAYGRNISDQELNGALVDLPHIEKCITDLDQKILSLKEKIEPKLPPTLKKKTVKISRSEIAEMLYGRKVKDLYETVIEDGKFVKKVVKPYYKPSVNFHKTDKINQYFGVHACVGLSPTFVKKKELTDWIKENHPDYPPKTWDISKEIKETKLLNSHTCKFFDVEETATDIICGPHTRIAWEQSRLSQHEVVKAFCIKLGWKDAEEWNFKTDEFDNKIKAEVDTEVRWPSYANPEDQIVCKVKKGKPLVTTPKLGEDDYEKLPPGLGEDISHYNTYGHRRRFFENPDEPDKKGLKAAIRSNGRVGCGVNNFNTATGRSSHYEWVNVPGDGALYGKEMRKTIVASEGKVLVGADQKSSQLSIAAYYANNKDYYDAVANGQEFVKNEEGVDIYVGESAHCVNARAFTLVSDEEWKKAVETQDKDLIHSISLRRGKSKGGSFSTLFGASGKKVASTLGIDPSLGTEKRDSFLKTIGLDKTLWILERMVMKNKRGSGGYIELPFGYYVWNNMPHKNGNYLIQGTEGCCQKRAENIFKEDVIKNSLQSEVNKILSYHDEYLVECSKNVAEEVGYLMVNSFTKVSQELHQWHEKNSKWFIGEDLPTFTIDLAGSYSIGENYYECH